MSEIPAQVDRIETLVNEITRLVAIGQAGMILLAAVVFAAAFSMPLSRYPTRGERIGKTALVTITGFALTYITLTALGLL